MKIFTFWLILWFAMFNNLVLALGLSIFSTIGYIGILKLHNKYNFTKKLFD